MECSIISLALSLLMKHLVIVQRQKAPNFSDFHWSLHSSLVSIGQHVVTTRVVHLPKRAETSLINESDQVVRAVHSWNSCFFLPFCLSHYIVISGTITARTLNSIHIMKNELSYHGIENQVQCLYSTFYLSYFFFTYFVLHAKCLVLYLILLAPKSFKLES